MSMIDDADDQTKDSIKQARERAQELGDHPEETDSSDQDESDEPRDTSGDVPVENLE
ncbi:hypothetical protein [Leucobacter denitrificans]|uniref:Uncharacterized protein n=1 Tax=Leucobacter denitrificans TaxID=683042 RepID=A0A7G9S2D4_9MICO|nr:hypothetical protein [Leucobacter denitrificans]QNN62009.1 hypothetical protein H9L06_06705 [Leucobacter denitrificans]